MSNKNDALLIRQVDTPTTQQRVNTYHLIKTGGGEDARAAIRHVNKIKQKLCVIAIALCVVVPMIIDKDATAFIFFAIFFLPMIFSKRCIMDLYSQ